MQPVRPLLPRRRPLHQQLRPRHNKHPHQSNAAPGSSKKNHQIESSSLNTDSVSQAQSILSEVQPDEPNRNHSNQTPAPIHHNWVYRRVVLPVLALLRMGASPEKLAWSLAAGLLIGINPILGSTTVLSLALAFVFRLNVAASQLGNHIVYPLELVLVIPFIRLASRVFHTAPMPLSANELLHAAREHPLALSRQLWLWEWHAFLLWAAIAVVAIPVIALTITPVLRLLLGRVRAHKYPVIPAI
jgi:uncharacterized protein (DUF2062 family)